MTVKLGPGVITALVNGVPTVVGHVDDMVLTAIDESAHAPRAINAAFEIVVRDYYEIADAVRCVSRKRVYPHQPETPCRRGKGERKRNRGNRW
jgi:hypothetical protein